MVGPGQTWTGPMHSQQRETGQPCRICKQTPDTRREYIFAEPSDYEFVARLWVANKKYLVTNVMSSAVLWFL
jgi:hypothetical protein